MDTEESSAGNPLLLVVEDNPGSQTLIRPDLLARITRSRQPQTGRPAPDKAFELIPDIIISDVMMPRKRRL
ncbi:MAG: hypothetical protein R3C61_27680 [Bacteroidia bacterium]